MQRKIKSQEDLIGRLTESTRILEMENNKLQLELEEYVEEKVANLVKNQDLSKFIL